MIDLIAVGLPSYSIDKINREELKNTKDLFNKVRGLEHLVNKKNIDKKNNTFKKEQKEPCKVCKKLNKGNRYHEETSCWYKTNDCEKEKGKQKNINFVNNSELEVELNDTDQKN